MAAMVMAKRRAREMVAAKMVVGKVVVGKAVARRQNNPCLVQLPGEMHIVYRLVHFLENDYVLNCDVL
jgi:hypothetical protein